VLLAALSLFVMFSPHANGLRNVVFDGYQRAFPLERVSNPTAVVMIDEASLAAYGQWPWPRTKIAELVTKISDAQPASIAFDIFFPEPDRFSPAAIAGELPMLPANLQHALEALPSNDQRLADAMKGRGVVMGVAPQPDFDPRFPNPPRAAPVALAKAGIDEHLAGHKGHIGSVAVIDNAAAGRGLINSVFQDQTVRLAPMIERVQGVYVPSLGVEALRVALGGRIRLEPERGGLLRMRFANVSMPLQEDGTAWIRFSDYDSANTISASEVFAGKDLDRLQQKVVFVGVTGLGTLDFKTTPLGEQVPGVMVHAQVAENLFNGVALVRPALAVRIEAAALILCGFILIAFVPRMSALQGINVVIGLVVVLAGAGLIAFRHFNLLFDFAWPALGTLAVFGSVVVGTLSEAERQRRMLREQAARMTGEVDAARRIQMGLLPNPKETLGADRRFKIAALLEPARTVGGDFYDCFMVDDAHLFFVVADVSGKGVPAALFMAAVKSHIKTSALRGGDVGEILSRAQEEIERENPEQLFVTAFAGRLELATGDLEFSNAGHEPPFGRSPRGAPERFPPPGGPPLCVMERYEFPSGQRKLVPGEWVCVVTDGATEAMNLAREFFGVERLRTSLSWMPEEVEPAELIKRLRDDVQRFAGEAEPADDITLLALRWEGTVRA
jgi:serine phosphatase RsbU (regulator of sigma subunit)/CHASE2 domain-containing sensor protein